MSAFWKNILTTAVVVVLSLVVYNKWIASKVA